MPSEKTITVKLDLWVKFRNPDIYGEDEKSLEGTFEDMIQEFFGNDLVELEWMKGPMKSGLEIVEKS